MEARFAAPPTNSSTSASQYQPVSAKPRIAAPYAKVLTTAAPTVERQVVLFHLGFNVAMALLFVGLTGVFARLLERWLVAPPPPPGSTRPQHLDRVVFSA